MASSLETCLTQLETHLSQLKNSEDPIRQERGNRLTTMLDNLKNLLSQPTVREQTLASLISTDQETNRQLWDHIMEKNLEFCERMALGDISPAKLAFADFQMRILSSLSKEDRDYACNHLSTLVKGFELYYGSKNPVYDWGSDGDSLSEHAC